MQYSSCCYKPCWSDDLTALKDEIELIYTEDVGEIEIVYTGIGVRPSLVLFVYIAFSGEYLVGSEVGSAEGRNGGVYTYSFVTYILYCLAPELF